MIVGGIRETAKVAIMFMLVCPPKKGACCREIGIVLIDRIVKAGTICGMFIRSSKKHSTAHTSWLTAL